MVGGVETCWRRLESNWKMLFMQFSALDLNETAESDTIISSCTWKRGWIKRMKKVMSEGGFIIRWINERIDKRMDKWMRKWLSG